MTEPSKWALNAAVAALGGPIRPYQAEAVAIALDAARRQALEQALQWVEAIHEGKDNSRDPAVVHNTCSRIEHAIRALIDREPTP